MTTLLINIIIFILTVNSNFNQKLDNYLNEKLSGFDKWNYEIVTQDEKLIENSAKIEIDLQRQFKRVECWGYIPVKVFEQNGACISSFISVRLNLFQSVLYSLRNIKNNSVLSASDFESEQKDITNFKGIPFVNLKDLSAYRAKLNIHKGIILLESMIEKIPLIKTGDEISAVFNGNSISISFIAKARENGSIGDQIKIETKDKKLFTAKVIKAGTVIIME
jgi:flagella basal body P-ring formation protein FlgA